MYFIQQFTLICMAVIVLVSPLINIYFIVKNASNQKQKTFAGFLGIGLYILFIILLLITFLIDT